MPIITVYGGEKDIRVPRMDVTLTMKLSKIMQLLRSDRIFSAVNYRIK